MDQHHLASLNGFTPAEMFEARKSLEMAIAGLAAERATSDQMVSMSEEIAEEAMSAHLMLAQMAQASEETDDAAITVGNRLSNPATKDGQPSWSSVNRNKDPARY